MVTFIRSFSYLYKMLRIIVHLVFIVSVALAAGSIVLSSRLRSKYRHDVISTLLYYQAFIFTFGFYGIWGQVVINAFLPGYVAPELVTRFSDIAMLLGLPFLVFAWLMLLRFSNDISGRKNNSWHIFLFLLINFGIITFVGYFIAKNIGVKPASMIKNYFIIMHFLFSLIASILIRIPGKERPVIHDYDRKIVSSGVFLIAVLQCLPLVFYKDQAFIALIFIFAFFAGHTFIPLYFTYGTLLTLFDTSMVKDMSFEEFCKKFDVSPRESEIIREIFNGLSNKEISEKLFISLQTVKDHTHRIYIKTNVRSRVHLINLLRK